MSDKFSRLNTVFKSGREVVLYLAVILCFGLAFGCFGGVLNNYLADLELVGMNEKGRGILEFFREMPGLFLVVIIALLSKRDEWWILRAGIGVAMAAIAGLFLAPPQVVVVTILVVLWSLGEHMLMPVRSSITMHLAKPGKEGVALGLTGSLSSIGAVTGSFVVVGIFYLIRRMGVSQRTGFDTVFVLVFMLMLVALLVAFLVKGKGGHVRRQRIYFHKKYTKFYILEMFYGARKQVFLTFAPFMLIKLYDMSVERMALLAGVCSVLNIVFAPLIGRIIDRLGYRTVMIWDTIFLFFVCILYGYADVLFPKNIALWIVCANFVLDILITNASMANNIYARGISDSREELTATLSTGISVNHLLSVLMALGGGLLIAAVTEKYGLSQGYGVIFSISAFMALMSALFTLTIPRPVKAAKV